MTIQSTYRPPDHCLARLQQNPRFASLTPIGVQVLAVLLPGANKDGNAGLAWIDAAGSL